MAHERRYKNVNRGVQLRTIGTILNSDTHWVFCQIRGYGCVITLEPFSAFP
jgi:hypothetical protein